MISRVAWVFASFALVACSGGSSTGGGDGMDAGGSSSGSSGSSNGGGNGSGSGSSSGSVSSSSGGSGGSTSSGGSGSGSSSGGSGSGSGSTSSSGSGSSSGGSSSGCISPADCAGQVCCATIPITGGSVPNCTSGTLTSACKPAAMCPTHLAIMCSGTETVQLCTSPSDCTNAGAGNTKCCTFTNDAGSLSFCASSLIGGVGGGTCM